MRTLLVVGVSAPPVVAETLDRMGESWKAMPSLDLSLEVEPDNGWSGAIVVSERPETALEVCRNLRHRPAAVRPIIVVVKSQWLTHFQASPDLFDDFVLDTAKSDEFEVRTANALWRSHGGTQNDVVEYGAVRLDISTYQCTIDDRPLDLTYMEYELLRHLVENAGRVYSRQELLRKVWGYEYYGGARTVDVHVRRLRAKIGEEHAQLIETVRSVGYKFGKTR